LSFFFFKAEGLVHFGGLREIRGGAVILPGMDKPFGLGEQTEMKNGEASRSGGGAAPGRKSAALPPATFGSGLRPASCVGIRGVWRGGSRRHGVVW
jgi:hypothetical protein